MIYSGVLFLLAVKFEYVQRTKIIALRWWKAIKFINIFRVLLTFLFPPGFQTRHVAYRV